MREFQDRRRVRRLLHSRYAIGALFVLLVLAAQALWGIHGKYEKSEELARRMESNLDGLRARKEKLEGLNASLGTTEGKEREIRDRFGVTREGERTIVIVDSPDGTDGIEPLAPTGWWTSFMDIFR